MSGHSKWHKIQHKKGKNDKARSAMFTKLLNAVTIAAQQGGGDVDMNFSLRLAVQKAKAGNVPKDNIDRAIKRGTGEAADGVIFTEGLYEGFGPGGIALLVETLTDNVNRTASDLKYIFSKLGGSMGASGSVSWQFERLAVIRLSAEQVNAIKEKRDELELALMDAGMTDLIEDDGALELRAPMDAFQKMLSALADVGITESADSALRWVPKDTMDVDDEALEKFQKMCDAFDENADVREVYTNLE